MSDTNPLVTAAEISRLAGVTRATVSNWRRRHMSFPSPAGGSDSRPLFGLREVQRWLADHGVESSEAPLARLRTLLRARVAPRDVPQLIDRFAAAGESSSAATGDDVVAAISAANESDGPFATLEALAERGLEDNPTTGVYATPPAVVDLIIALVEGIRGTPPNSAFDPACGSGALLAATARVGVHEFYGQDVLPVQAKRAAALFAFTDNVDKVDIRHGDSLFDDEFPGLQADLALSNPPYSQRDWGSEELSLDPRWEYGPPPRSESELAWVQHLLFHLTPGGLAVLLLPPSVSVRSSGRRIRAALLRAGAIRAVIALPSGIATPRHIGLHLWVLRRPEPSEPPADEVFFADTSRVADERTTWAATVDTIAAAWSSFDHGEQATTIPDIAAAVRVMEILDEDVDLNPSRYVRAAVDASNIAAAVARARSELETSIEVLDGAAVALPEWTAGEASWRTATIADLVAGGAMRVVAVRSAPEGEHASELEGRPLLSSRDIALGSPPGAVVGAQTRSVSEPIAVGDVLVLRVRSNAQGNARARVAGPEDEGAAAGEGIAVLRPDATRMDPWFLAGFAGSDDNAHSTLGTTMRIDPSRIRIPLLPLPQQQRFALAFRQLYDLQMAALRAATAAATTAGLISSGLTAGALEPPNTSRSTERKQQRGRK
ncbi:N-6 DNA methylase [Nocardia terpenica]|uniref:N-6 DNA methylase n=1 Tax=Nocardia terpenica TaxID=455432 RepID=UPI001895CFA9|nr:N-6 DNA methylase [Nocardia terpenica]MBF6060456.1 N-6 DNA methylase [Nocardia terpenica]MBF6103716.1 N-6 DNA methylase [Nocardia terpenica]MBF6111910.1 N-6 DNA methylase [Nocardia terpenica]MBF6117937.1 N-6 DNA methylase [Nocardia terpenica]MBF6155337.1 N-6 DNA methylase [Nocardia terpenica]